MDNPASTLPLSAFIQYLHELVQLGIHLSAEVSLEEGRHEFLPEVGEVRQL